MLTPRYSSFSLSRPVCALLSLLLLSACSPVEDPSLYPEYDESSMLATPAKPATPASPTKNVFFGDLHIHTSYSTDAYTMGVRGLPDDAYTFAKGGTIKHPLGTAIRLKQPLDFAAVTDHSEFLGVVREAVPDTILAKRSIRERLLEDGRLLNTWLFLRIAPGFSLKDLQIDNVDEIVQTTWQNTIEAAERHDDPGRFTAFIGYEWSSMPNAENLHRNVIYRGNRGPRVPFSSLDSENPEDLWSALEAQRKQGLDNIAIPHNGNVSNGRMYETTTYLGEPITPEYAERRIANEPISEIFQVKGSSETHPTLSPNDPFADFEIVNQMLGRETQNSKPRGSYMRDALRTGIEFAHERNYNPYRFGVIGSSDGHNASSPIEEDNYHGKLPLLDGSAAIRLKQMYLLPEEAQRAERWGAAGLAAVWARENTREALFDAMRAKETYATSGTRIQVRFFAGFNLDDDLLSDPNWIKSAYAKGVPMGGKLTARDDRNPTFIVHASKDALAANLDRIQIIKGWVDNKGKSHEKIFDVALSPNREAKFDTAQPNSVGNTVDVTSATYTNTIGSPQLSGTWQDPEYNPEQHAFYYARVLEIPTPRWSTYDAKTLGIEAPQPTSIQERAVSSAIWLAPPDC
ncbi:DUF3604 domain-containing protein [Aequoribacter sp.]|uniref:DUF3604 domain-containing protein n=2 Tax=Aequoribacter sp. TaxID=2847771 RepID=UPI003C551191